MHVIYIDESGTPEPGSNSSHFVLVGLAINLRDWKTHDAAIHHIKAKYRMPNAEVHTAWMARWYPEQERIVDFAKLSDDKRRRAVRLERRADLAKASLLGDHAVRSLRKNYQKSRATIGTYNGVIVDR